MRLRNRVRVGMAQTPPRARGIVSGIGHNGVRTRGGSDTDGCSEDRS